MYWLRLLFNPKIVIALAIAVGLSASHWKVYKVGQLGERKEWQAKNLQGQLERAQLDNKALKQAAADQQLIETEYAALKSDLVNLQKSTTAVRSQHASAVKRLLNKQCPASASQTMRPSSPTSSPNAGTGQWGIDAWIKSP